MFTYILCKCANLFLKRCLKCLQSSDRKQGIIFTMISFQISIEPSQKVADIPGSWAQLYSHAACFLFFNFIVVQHYFPLHCQGWDVFGRSFEPEADLSHTMCSYNKTVRKLTKVIRAPKKMIKDQFRIQTLLSSRRTCEANFQQKTFFDGFWICQDLLAYRRKQWLQSEKKGDVQKRHKTFSGMRATCRKKPAL